MRMVKTFVNIITRQKKMLKVFLDISTHFVGPSPSFSIATGSHFPSPTRPPPPSSPTNGFVGNTFNVFSHTKIWRKTMCIYLFCNFSEEFNCKGNVSKKKNKRRRRRRKSMYSDYASGIAFLIKTNSSIKGWCHDQHPVCGALAWEAALSTAPLWKLPGTMMEEFEASQAAGVSDRKRRGQSESKLIVAMLGDVFRRLSEKFKFPAFLFLQTLLLHHGTYFHAYCVTPYIFLNCIFRHS